MELVRWGVAAGVLSCSCGGVLCVPRTGVRGLAAKADVSWAVPHGAVVCNRDFLGSACAGLARGRQGGGVTPG